MWDFDCLRLKHILWNHLIFVGKHFLGFHESDTMDYPWLMNSWNSNMRHLLTTHWRVLFSWPTKLPKNEWTNNNHFAVYLETKVEHVSHQLTVVRLAFLSNKDKLICFSCVYLNTLMILSTKLKVYLQLKRHCV